MINAYREGTNDGALYESLCDHDSHDCEEADEFSKSEYGDFIQSIQQTEWDVEIVKVENTPIWENADVQGHVVCKSAVNGMNLKLHHTNANVLLNQNLIQMVVSS